ncbi:hypothetical protein AVEN_79486-1 [Araneus ventricosus]|uniref:Uncharacterized protein n=1 Tax=Araneus ventricosus TaxID=182803 RepID=A0A4Y2L5L3_ARAVE|nr:hypothetical protein AVEN_79486-1 [Araneus ventricosus]
MQFTNNEPFCLAHQLSSVFAPSNQLDSRTESIGKPRVSINILEPAVLTQLQTKVKRSKAGDGDSKGKQSHLASLKSVRVYSQPH